MKPKPEDYPGLLTEIKERIRTAQYEALKVVNKELVGLYWDIGRMILERQEVKGWGKSVVERLSADLRQEQKQYYRRNPASLNASERTSGTALRTNRHPLRRFPACLRNPGDIWRAIEWLTDLHQLHILITDLEHRQEKARVG